MKNSNIMDTITENLSTCHTTAEEIVDLLKELDSAECTDPNFPPIFVMIFTDYIQFHEKVRTIQELLTDIETQVNELAKN